MSVRKKLTDENVAELPIRKKRYLVHDALVPGLAVRVGKSRRTWVLIARFKEHTSRRSLGIVGKITVEQARVRAQRAHAQMQGEVDVHVTFSEVLDKLVHSLGTRTRYPEELDRALRRDVPSWMARPISTITRRDVVAALDARRAKKSKRKHGTATTLSAAHHMLSYARRVFNFAVDRDLIEHAPTDRMRSSIISAKAVRSRVLTDQEIGTTWRNAETLSDDYRDAVQLLILTGARRSEIAALRLKEIDLTARTVTLSADRTKSSAAHILPLGTTALKIVTRRMADTDRGQEYLFGRELRGFGKVSKRITQGCEHFTIHDLRRTMRTRLASLRVPEHIAEAAIGHAKKGLQRVYNQYAYADELREAFERYDELVRGIVETPRAQQPAPLQATTLAK
jgi:integrase